MGMDDIDYELIEAIDELIASGIFDEDSAALGIAKKISSEGRLDLSPDQQWVFDRYIAPHLRSVHQEWETNRIMNSNPD